MDGIEVAIRVDRRQFKNEETRESNVLPALKNVVNSPEDTMKKYNAKFFLLWLAAMLLAITASNIAIAQEPPPQQQPPAHVVGSWTIYAKDPNGSTSTKYIQLNQNGTVLSGHFKGPNQSGGLQGTIDEQHIVFRTKTREPLTFRGRVEGDRVGGRIEGTSIQGTFHTRAGTGEFQAVRSN
jgi:hypothetical protein